MCRTSRPDRLGSFYNEDLNPIGTPPTAGKTLPTGNNMWGGIGGLSVPAVISDQDSPRSSMDGEADANTSATGQVGLDVAARASPVAVLQPVEPKISAFSPPKFLDPVVAADGYVYERKSIMEWISQRQANGVEIRSPVTDEILQNLLLTPKSESDLCIGLFCGADLQR